MSLIIRPATPADAAVVTEFNRLLAFESEEIILDPVILAAGVATALADPDRARYFLAEQDGKVAGQLMFTREWSDWRNGWLWWLQSVYVHADHRRQGVFRAMFDHVEQMIRQDPEVKCLRSVRLEHANTVAQEALTPASWDGQKRDIWCWRNCGTRFAIVIQEYRRRAGLR